MGSEPAGRLSVGSDSRWGQTTVLNVIRETERRLADHPTEAQLDTARALMELLNHE